MAIIKVSNLCAPLLSPRDDRLDAFDILPKDILSNSNFLSVCDLSELTLLSDDLFELASPGTLPSDERWVFNSTGAVPSEIFGSMPAAPAPSCG